FIATDSSSPIPPDRNTTSPCVCVAGKDVPGLVLSFPANPDVEKTARNIKAKAAFVIEILFMSDSSLMKKMPGDSNASCPATRQHAVPGIPLSRG
ncbi:MAG: hypothetical protein ABIO50_07075, partial [Nitrosospira sp.]